MQAHIKNDGQKESVNRSEIIMGGENPIVLFHRVRVGECNGTEQPQHYRLKHLESWILEKYLVSVLMLFLKPVAQATQNMLNFN